MVETKRLIVGATAIMIVFTGWCFGLTATITLTVQVGNVGIVPQGHVISTGGMEVKTGMAGHSPIQVEINYPVTQPGIVKLQVYRPNGSMVRELVNATQSAGPYHVVWDGLDKNGAGVNTGVYLLVLDRDGRRLTKMVTLLK